MKTAQGFNSTGRFLLLLGCIGEHKIYLERSKEKPRERDSGWYIGPVDGLVSEYEALFVYELLTVRRSVMQILDLPFGFLAVFEGDSIEAILNEKDRDVWAQLCASNRTFARASGARSGR